MPATEPDVLVSNAGLHGSPEFSGADPPQVMLNLRSAGA
jgi:hypothetical protein